MDPTLPATLSTALEALDAQHRPTLLGKIELIGREIPIPDGVPGAADGQFETLLAFLKRGTHRLGGR